jgi:hypothetical protein
MKTRWIASRAYELLKARAADPTASGTGAPNSAGAPTQPWYTNIPGISGVGTAVKGGRRGDSLGEAMAKSAARTIGSTVGRQLVRGILGSLLGGKK